MRSLFDTYLLPVSLCCVSSYLLVSHWPWLLALPGMEEDVLFPTIRGNRLSADSV